MSTTRKRQPRELLSSINKKLLAAAGADDTDWAWAALSAGTVDVFPRLTATQPDNPKRPSYYGAKGSIRNPFRP